MNISRFFIDRPIFAAVVAVFITLMGVFAYPLLPLSQYPEIAPPTITINTAYPGASAETVAETVAAPIEQEVNGVEGMLYVSSSSTSDGAVSVTVTFQPGTDLDAAQVLVQNRVALAEPRLPEQVRQIGVTVNKQESGFLMILGMTSPDKSLDNDYVGNYANSTLRDRLLRLEGVGAVQIFGGGNYAMRVWIDPGKAAARGLTGPDIVAALRAQNVQAAAGAIGQPPFATNAAAFQLPVQVQGRLSDPDQFSNIVIKTDAEGRVTRVRDIARVELGAQDYGIRGFFDGERGVGVAIIQQPGANALGTAERVLAEVEAIKADLPQGMDVSVAYNPTEFVAASVESVQHTLIEAVILVVLVVIVFLQTWRAAIIPIVAIPVALVATFAVQLALGYSINSLSLFALVLAVGIVVDDAIVVVENVERYIREGLTPKEAAYRSMQEVSGALISIGLVLVSVFVPTMFVPGIPGIFYREFAIVITTASVVSLIVSLTLSPAMAALLLKPHKEHDNHRKPGLLGTVAYYGGYAGRKFNEGFDWLSDKYGRLTARLVRTIGLMLVIYVALLGLTTWRLLDTPSGFIPEQDQGFLIGVIQLPPGASLERTEAVMTRASEIIKGTDGVEGMVAFAGLDGSSFSFGSNAATIFIRLDAFKERKSAEQAAAALAGAITGATMGIEDANIFVIAPPAVQGLGNGNGFQMMVQDRTGAGYRPLEGATFAMMGAAAGAPDQVEQVFSTYNTGSPRIAADVDRDKALMMGVQPSDVFNTLGVYLGSSYVNDFNFLGRTFRVTAQAEPSARDDIADIANLQTRSASGAMVPIGSVATLREDSGPARIVRYNLFPAAELQGQAAAGVSSGQAIASMEQLAEATLPPGFSYEWTGLALQEKQSSGGATIVFIMAVVLVFLVLAAQYEAFTLPLSVVLIVPMCILAAMIGINIRGLDNNILVQVGLVVLIALAAKNAILIVEFAKQAEDEGLNRWDAAVRAAKTRLRPILMTSFAFIFGVVPLMLATGAGAEMRQSLGTAVFSGMLGVTFFGLIFTPVFYVLMRGVAARLPGKPKKEPGVPTTGGLPPHGADPAPATPRPGDA
ncbi:MAG: multidrug efflux RND transporter permease subunit [Brevundimonas sp.]|uniref:efflux RND transporter permease subunit n=3 Tax=Brevundimonas sp. TaxID=1871086 RepID=UPI002743427B|nr:multidrug efflux RND transporter permease subunit [Brevundimonas sp.]MDP3079992.1 multidrug efflux RND transporter permease subunit [Brevundimonas sp.]MDZ4113128.1 multidrug efflux RND transporter permease subunit [Brevundimonas sp.]